MGLPFIAIVAIHFFACLALSSFLKFRYLETYRIIVLKNLEWIYKPYHFLSSKFNKKFHEF